ncbi:MAG: NAD(P)H-dependent oxidoreductase [Chitinophagales bacterium]|nr:NAD(P)H-dependent oxidoreductase [Chitinophagales bacterium]
MWTIISGTNRKGSNTLKIAQTYHQLAVDLNVDTRLISLEELPNDFIHVEMYRKRSASLEEFAEKYLYPASKFTFITPEYNGTFPGIFKLMMDAVDVDRAFKYKHVCLVGTSTGRAGNLRGMDDLTNACMYLKMHVFHQRIPISSVKELIDVNGQVHDSYTRKVMEEQIIQFNALK